MSPPTKKQLNKGFHGFQDDSYEFLQTCNKNSDRGNWDASASGVGCDGTKDDDYGYRRGELGFTAEGGDGAVYNRMPDESIDAPHERLADLLDNQNDQPAGKILGGGGGVSDNKHGGVGRGGPRFAPKTGPRVNARSR